jgi:hypothetical protein
VPNVEQQATVRVADLSHERRRVLGCLDVVGERSVLERDPHPGRFGIVSEPVETLAQHLVLDRNAVVVGTDLDVVDTQDRCRFEQVLSPMESRARTRSGRVNPNPTYPAAPTASMRVRIGIGL